MKKFNSLKTFIASNISFGPKSLEKLVQLIPDIVEIKLNGILI